MRCEIWNNIWLPWITVLVTSELILEAILQSDAVTVDNLWWIATRVNKNRYLRQTIYYFIFKLPFGLKARKTRNIPTDPSLRHCCMRWKSRLWYRDVTQIRIVTSFWPIMFRKFLGISNLVSCFPIVVKLVITRQILHQIHKVINANVS